MQKVLKSVRLLTVGLVTTLLLAACGVTPRVTSSIETQVVGDPYEYIDPYELRGIGEEGLPLVGEPGREENCVANQFSLPGQGTHIKGVIGGLGLYSEPQNIPRNFGATSAEERGRDILANLLRTDSFSDAAILVVDDFQGGVFTLGQDVYDLPQHLTELDESVLNGLQANRQISHGAVVMNHINALLSGTGLYTPSQPEPGVVLWTHNVTNARFVVMAVDTGLVRTSVIERDIREGVNRLRKVYDINRSVVNMSFAIMPCNLLEDFAVAEAQGQVASFYEYLEIIAGNYGLTADELLYTLVMSVNLTGDPLRDLIETPQTSYGSDEHIYVASAGNFGADFPMFPAGWDGVVSVSGSSVDDPEVRPEIPNRHTGNGEPLFNAGEILETGAWFALSDPKGLNGSSFTLGNPRDNVFYLGTSFSAPTVSFFSALDWARHPTRCGIDPRDDRPYLAHYPVSGGHDEPLEGALGYCP